MDSLPEPDRHGFFEDEFGPPITVREATDNELSAGFGPIKRDGPHQKCPKYLVCQEGDRMMLIFVFGMPQGGNTREEAVFWAERVASKNGLRFIRPDGWENVEGQLPEEGESSG